MTGITIGILIAVLGIATTLVAIGPGSLRRALSGLIPSLDPNHFTCRILKLEEETDGNYTDVLKIQIQGLIRAPHDHCDTDLQIRLTDVTEGRSEFKPVLCKRQEWSAEGSPAYEYKIHNGILPARVSALTDWVTVVEFRTTELVFPRRGSCTLECTLSVLEKETGKPLATAKGRTDLISESRGYEEIQQQRHTKQTATLQLAASIWELTGRNPEGRILLDQWFEGQSFGSEQTLESIIASYSGSQERWIEEACDGLLGWADPADRYTAVEFCLKIAAAGSSIQKELIGRLRNIMKKLEIPEDRFQSLSQKYLTGRVGQMEDPMALLGLTEEMTEDQIRQKLTAEYRKWNARVTHPNAAVRQQADQMLNLITQLRSKYAHHA